MQQPERRWAYGCNVGRPAIRLLLRLRFDRRSTPVRLRKARWNCSRTAVESHFEEEVESHYSGVYEDECRWWCWVSTWRRRSTRRWNVLGQATHVNGLRPECLRLWVMRFDDWLNALPHWRHTYGFSPAATVSSLTLSLAVKYYFETTLHCRVTSARCRKLSPARAI